MENVQQIEARIKAVGELPISSTAKAIGFAIAALGTACPKKLIEATGFARATLYRALAEYHEHCGYIPTSLTIPTCPTSEIPTNPIDGNCSQKPVSLVPPVGISEPAPSRVRANTELPSEVTSSQTVSQSVSGRPAEEFSNCKQAFNGATEAMVAEVIHAMGGNERDRPNAVKWLATTLASYGPDPVRDAFAMLATKRAENKPIASVLPWWSKTAASLKAKPKPAAAPAKGEAPRHRVSPDTIRYAKPAPGSEYIPEAANA